MRNLDKLVKMIQTKMPASSKELEFAEKMKRGMKDSESKMQATLSRKVKAMLQV